MKISAITIENFKSISEPVRIELKPITMLFGPNSVGKSSVIQALHYAREIFCNRRYQNLDRVEYGGDHVRLGDFQNIVHGHDLNRAIRMRFEISSKRFGWCDGEAYIDDVAEDTDLNNFPEEQQKLVTDFLKDQLAQNHSPWIEITIRQYDQKSWTYVSSTSIGFGDTVFMVIENSELKFINEDCSLFPLQDGINISKILMATSKNIVVQGGEENVSVKIGYAETLPRHPLQLILHGEYWPKISLKEACSQIGIDTRSMCDQFEDTIDAIYTAIFDTVQNDLNKFRYVGPLRAVPDRNYSPSASFDLTRWANGLAAWDHMTNNEHTVTMVNYWLSERFNTGYEIVREQSKEIKIDSPLYKQLMQPSCDHGCESVTRALEELPVKIRLFIRDKDSNIELQSTDIGIGISQVLPLIPLSLQDWGDTDDYENFIAIEQPELHIHPAMCSASVGNGQSSRLQ